MQKHRSSTFSCLEHLAPSSGLQQSPLLNGKAALSPEMALRIEKAFDVSMDMLLQAWYDASQMRARESEMSPKEMR